MQSLNELNARILNITTDIHLTYPELSKYLEETKNEIPEENSKEITKGDLQDYFELLKRVLNTYKLAHLNTKRSKDGPAATK